MPKQIIAHNKNKTQQQNTTIFLYNHNLRLQPTPHQQTLLPPGPVGAVLGAFKTISLLTKPFWNRINCRGFLLGVFAWVFLRISLSPSWLPF